MKKVASLVLFALFVSLVPLAPAQPVEQYDLLITNARIVDGTGNPWFWGSVGIRDGKIAGVGRINGTSAQTIDAKGQIVAPGFIETDMTAELPEESGTVVLELPRSWGELWKAGLRLDLFVDGRPLPLREMEAWVEKQGYLFSSAARELVLPRLALARYRACLGPGGAFGRIAPAAYRLGRVACDEGRLEDGEELRLKPTR